MKTQPAIKTALPPIKAKLLVPEEPKTKAVPEEPKPEKPKPPSTATKNYTIAVLLKVATSLPRPLEPVMIRSAIELDGQRVINVTLNGAHLLVSRSLKRADSLLLRFIISLAIVEYLQFWGNAPDGKPLRAAILRTAKIEGEGYFGISLASKLAASELLRSLDSMPIFGPTPVSTTHTLFTFHATLMVESRTANWNRRQEER
jgi:hypothetical protein